MISSIGAPVEVDGVIYAAEGLSLVFALDARSGRLLWSYDPKVALRAGTKLREGWGIRGIAYGMGRVFVGTQDGRLFALDAKSGTLEWQVETTAPGDSRYITGAPRYYNGKVVVGHGGADFGATRGYVTAYDAAKGQELWRFYTVPGDPSKGFENEAMRRAASTWSGRWWERGGGGTVWNGITFDPETNLLFIGTGNGSPWNQAVRSPGGGDNLYLCSVIALNADTGSYVWHYQLNPGESWDYTATTDITLATMKIAGKDRPVLFDAPKNGFFYVIDRRTGQLISAKPIVKVNWADRIDLKSGRPVENPAARDASQPFLQWPGPSGAHNWPAMSYSPVSGLVYLPVGLLPGLYDRRGVTPDTWQPSSSIVFDESIKIMVDEPAPKPNAPLGQVLAWDPKTQSPRWSAPLAGPTNGGILSTAGNLVFQGYADGRFTARAADSGDLVWSFDAQNGILSHPITYSLDGKQYVTIVTGFAGTGTLYGEASAQFGWDYRTQKRRVLTFSLDAKQALPPPDPRSPVRPIEESSFVLDKRRRAAGFALYSRRCVVCHGFGAVAGGSAPDLRASAITLNAETFARVVHDGALEGQGMPAYRELCEEDLDNLRHYLRARAHESSNSSP